MKIAGAQINPLFSDKAANLRKITAFTLAASQAGAKLVVFPEGALTGYCFGSKEEAMQVAEVVPGSVTKELAELAAKERVDIIFGMLEKSEDRLFNVAVLVSGEGVVGLHRKAHLPYVAVDRFCTPGDLPFKVFDSVVGRVGMNICYDGSFPEAVRVLKLAGAQLIALPSNWPAGVAEISCRHIPIVRACENHVNYIAVNRVGEERGFRFIGQSKVIDYDARILAEADDSSETLIVANIDMPGADRNRFVYRPGELEMDRIADRRPDLYGPIVRKQDHWSPAAQPDFSHRF